MNNYQKKLWQRAKFAFFLLRGLPFIRLIAVNGSLAQGKIHSQSDIDFFIIVKYGRLWLVRFFAYWLLDLFNLRAKNEYHRAKICLNHLLTDQDYLLDRRDSYNAHQYGNLAVLYNLDNSYKQFRQKNSWINDFSNPTKQSQIELKNDQMGFLKKSWEKLLAGFVGDYLESKLKKFQLERIKNKVFFHQPDSVLKTTDKEFYYYTNISKKYCAKS